MRWYFWVLLIVFIIVLFTFIAGCSIRSKLFSAKPSTKLTAEQLCNLSDSELVIEIITLIDAGGNTAEDKAAMESLNKSELASYTVARFDMEIQNGGLCQYFSNSSRYTAQYLSESLLTIGAKQTEKKFTAFIQKNSIDVMKLNEFIISSNEEYIKKTKAYTFDEYDNNFYNNYRNENLESLNADFIRNNITDFIK